MGYLLHSALLVPYFSWQRSHAVHHSRTNHVDEGETHVPMKASAPDGAQPPPARRLAGGGGGGAEAGARLRRQGGDCDEERPW